MKFAINRDHRDQFREHQAIECEGLLSPEEISELLKAVDAGLALRLRIKPSELVKQSSERIFSVGRDLWRVAPPIKKVVMQSRFAEIAADLAEQRMLRLGYDQFFPSIEPSPIQEKGGYFSLLQQASSLTEVSCLQGITGGLLLCLSGESPSSQSTIFPSRPGNGVFFKAGAAIPFPQLNTHPQKHLLIVYTQATAVYVHRDKDPLAHVFKSVGYTYGDKLVDKWNPIVYR
ncbi:MAG: hypothetical protein H0X51_04810 [Parachlamydiaceae bacterium]|nr:hypothetical protein [Parachlamydiaceae bacterium]